MSSDRVKNELIELKASIKADLEHLETEYDRIDGFETTMTTRESQEAIGQAMSYLRGKIADKRDSIQNIEWRILQASRGICPACGGSGIVQFQPDPDAELDFAICTTCGGTGRLTEND